MTDPNIVALLGIIAISACLTPLILIGVAIVISAHLTELRTSVVGLHIWLMNANSDADANYFDDEDDSDSDDDEPPHSTPALNNVPLYTNEQIDDIVDKHIFLDNGTSTYRVWEDRASKYLREMRDTYEREIAFWQRYGVAKNLELVEVRAAQPPTPAEAAFGQELERELQGRGIL